MDRVGGGAGVDRLIAASVAEALEQREAEYVVRQAELEESTAARRAKLEKSVAAQEELRNAAFAKMMTESAAKHAEALEARRAELEKSAAAQEARRSAVFAEKLAASAAMQTAALETLRSVVVVVVVLAVAKRRVKRWCVPLLGALYVVWTCPVLVRRRACPTLVRRGARLMLCVFGPRFSGVLVLSLIHI